MNETTTQAPKLSEAQARALEAVELQLGMWGDQFYRLERKLEDAAPARRRALEKRLADLRAEKRVLQVRLRASTRESSSWEEIQRELAEALHGFRRSAARIYDLVHA